MDFDDVLNIGSGPGPSNRNPAFADAALQCITDLVDCCGTESGILCVLNVVTGIFLMGTELDLVVVHGF